MQVVTVCGSHAPASTNAIVLGEITERLRAAGLEVDAAPVHDDVTAFRPHRVDTPPPDVVRLREVFERADAVVFSVPEYAGGVPGWVKNITDWMVVSGSLYERPVAVMSSSTSGGDNAIADLARTLTWQGARVVVTCGIEAPLTKTGADRVTHPGTLADLDRVAAVIVDVLRSDPERTVELAAAELHTLGIDRFERRVR